MSPSSNRSKDRFWSLIENPLNISSVVREIALIQTSVLIRREALKRRYTNVPLRLQLPVDRCRYPLASAENHSFGWQRTLTCRKTSRTIAGNRNGCKSTSRCFAPWPARSLSRCFVEIDYTLPPLRQFDGISAIFRLQRRLRTTMVSMSWLQCRGQLKPYIEVWRLSG